MQEKGLYSGMAGRAECSGEMDNIYITPVFDSDLRNIWNGLCTNAVYIFSILEVLP